MQQGIIVLPGDAAAAGCEKDAGALAQLCQHPGLQRAEAGLALLGKDLRDGHPGLLRNDLIRVQNGAAQPFAQCRGHRALAAAGHTDENDIFQPLPQQRHGAVDLAFRNGPAGKKLPAAFGLRRQHGQAAAAWDAKRLRLQHKTGAGGVVDDVQNALAGRKRLQLHRRRRAGRIHSHRRGVHQQLCVPVAVQVLIVVRAAAGDHSDAGCAQLPQYGAHRHRSAAAAQYQGLFAPDGDTALQRHAAEAEIIGIVAVKRAVRPADQRVYAAQQPGLRRKRIASGGRKLFIGDGHIQPVPWAVLQKIVQLLPGAFKQPVGRITQ